MRNLRRHWPARIANGAGGTIGVEPTAVHKSTGSAGGSSNPRERFVDQWLLRLPLEQAEWFFQLQYQAAAF